MIILAILLVAGAAWGAATLPPEIKSPAVGEAWLLLQAPTREHVEKANTLLNEALQKDPHNVEARMGLVYLGITEYSLNPKGGAGPLREALRHVDAVLNTRPDLVDAYRKKSLVLFLSGRMDEGFALLERALKRWPGSHDLNEAYLAYLLNLGKVEEAMHFSHLENSPAQEKETLFLRLGRVWLQAGYPEQSDHCIEHSLHSRETPQGWAAWGRSFMRRKDYPMAIEFFQRALGIDAKHSAIYNELAFCYHQVGQPREAIRWMESYTRDFPNDLVALGNLAGLYEGVGEKVKARLAWMKVKAKTLDPQQARLAGERLERLKKN